MKRDVYKIWRVIGQICVLILFTVFAAMTLISIFHLADIATISLTGAVGEISGFIPYNKVFLDWRVALINGGFDIMFGLMAIGMLYLIDYFHEESYGQTNQLINIEFQLIEIKNELRKYKLENEENASNV